MRKCGRATGGHLWRTHRKGAVAGQVSCMSVLLGPLTALLLQSGVQGQSSMSQTEESKLPEVGAEQGGKHAQTLPECEKEGREQTPISVWSELGRQDGRGGERREDTEDLRGEGGMKQTTCYMGYMAK